MSDQEPRAGKCADNATHESQEHLEYTEQFYAGRTPGEIEATLTLTLTSEAEDAPPMSACRYAVLTILTTSQRGLPGYVIYDRILNRIVDGIYYLPLEAALQLAANLNASGAPYKYSAPNGAALGLRYPG